MNSTWVNGCVNERVKGRVNPPESVPRPVEDGPQRITFLLDLCPGKTSACVEKLIFSHAFIPCMYGEPTVCQPIHGVVGTVMGKLGGHVRVLVLSIHLLGPWGDCH